MSKRKDDGEDDLQPRRLPRSGSIQPFIEIMTFTVTRRAGEAIRKLCEARGLAPTMTWEQPTGGEGRWILGFHRTDNASDQLLSCDLETVDGLSFLIDGPAAARPRLSKICLDYQDGHFTLSE